VTETVYLGLGSNLGDRLASLQGAVDLLRIEAGIELIRSSRVWETVPVGGPEQPDFLNAVLRAEVGLAPLDLLAACQRVEAALGRVREVRWGPRTIDVDVLMIGARAIDDPGLVVPHPRMHERAFVLMPLLEIDPDPVLANGTRLLDVRLGPDAVGGVRVFAPPLRLG
jgi:2-amino-4-hydroxy-6-hydroxymethyldihydropteridine diphosphokinase